MTDAATSPLPHAGQAHLEWTGFGMLPQAARDALIGAGAPYELTTERVGERELQVFVRRPGHLREMLDEVAASTPDLPFLIAGERVWTFSDAVTEIDAIGRLLVDAYGVGQGDRVAIVAANSPEYGLTM